MVDKADVNAMKRPSVVLMEGSVFAVPGTEFPLMSTDTRSVL
jgi:hypothetical protein